MKDPINVISLGAGVQSSCMAIMATHGLIEPMPSAAVFADTGAEPEAVYRWLDWLETKLSFPVYRVSAGNIVEHIHKAIKGERFATAPFFTESVGGGGMLRRQCTREFKLDPMNKKFRELAGLKPRQRTAKPVVISWVGISTDEAARMKPSREAWRINRYPLAMELRMSRADCLCWMREQGYPQPPSSACTFCPFHSNHEWRRIRDDPASWSQVIGVDRAIRGGVHGTREKLYLHRSMQPLEEVDLSTPEEMGQIDAFGNECDGVCGV